VGFRLGIGILVVGQSMIFGLALNLHDDVPPAARWITQSLILCGTVIVVALLGPPLFRAAWGELRRGRLTIEALFLLTISGALGASLQAFIAGRGPIYFEVVSVLLVVYTLGKVIGARSRTAAFTGARAWSGQLSACRVVDAAGQTRHVPITEIRPGDVVEVSPGEACAVDGIIRDGVGFVSEISVSGEPFPIVRRPGDRVTAGAASHDATFRIEATQPGNDRQIDRIFAAVETARDKPLSLQRRADAVGRWLFPLVVATAVGTFGYWTFLTHQGWEVGLYNAMSVLLIACPCAIGLATPVVIWLALGRLAERGLIVRGGDAIERLAAINLVMFDKTGTLTDDSFSLLDIVTTVTGDARAALLGWVSVIQERSKHPAARPFAALPRSFSSANEPQVETLRAVPGCGVEAFLMVSGVGHSLRIGTPQWIAEVCPAEPSVLPTELKAAGHRVDVALDGELVAVAVLAERLRDSAQAAMAELQRIGIGIEVLTGDTAERAANLGLQAVQAELLPDAKRAAVAAAIANGRKPLFVGDGVNDAAALAAGYTGIALASGTDLAVEAADFTLYHGDLRVIPWAVLVSREAVRNVRRNVRRAVCYNLCGVALAAAGVLHPVVAVVLMTLASLSLIFSSTRGGCGFDGCESPLAISPTRDRPSWNWRAALHGIAFALQGVVIQQFLFQDVNSMPLIAGFALLGIAIGLLWNRWATIPHTIDMCVGMLTLGNLGMLLGWWADNGFSAIPETGCCHCVEAFRAGVMQPWMWLGMLFFSNVAMLALPRQPLALGSTHTIAMYSGGNLGMVAGMITGGWCATQIISDSITLAFVVDLGGMTVGMLAGMLAGTWLSARLIEALLGLAAALRSATVTNVPTTE